jgi:Nuclease-related domain
MSHPRRQQLARLIRGVLRAAGGLALLILALLAASADYGTLGSALAVGAGLLALGSRRQLRLAHRSRIGAESEAAVRRSLRGLASERWRIRHAVDWAESGDLDHVARAPSGLGFVIETKTRAYSAAHIARTLRAARWLARRRRGYPRGVVAVICVTRPSEMDARVKGGFVFWRVGGHGGCAGAGRPARDGNDDWSL